jgi:hypothetical protein
VCPRYLGRHQVDVVVTSNCQKQVRFAHAGVSLNVDVDPVPLEQLDSFQL